MGISTLVRGASKSALLAALLALLAPIPAALLLAMGFAYEDTNVREALNAGQVLGGAVHPDGIDVVLDRTVERGHAVWVLGNSNAQTDIDREVLAAGLGVGVSELAVLSIPNANTAHWIAMLRRLQGAERRPSMVLVVSRLQLVLIREPISEGARRSLRALLRDNDDDIRDLAEPAGNRTSAWLRRREATRDRIGQELRVALPYVLGFSRPETVLRRALSDDRVDVDLLGPPPTRRVPAPDDSLVPLLAELSRSLGVRLVVARPPASPLASAQQADLVPEGFAQRTQALLAQNGASFVDLQRLPMQRHHYRNVDHLAEEGATRLTTALLAYLEPETPVVDALGRPRFVDGELVAQRGVLTYVAPPPELREVAKTVNDGARIGVHWADAPPSVPPDAWTMEHTPQQSRCSPLRIRTHNGLLAAGRPCKRLVDGSSCHGPERVGWMARAANDDVGMVLDPDRSCESAAWLYPDDEVVIRWPHHVDLDGPPTHVVLRAEARRPRASVRAVVRQRGEIVGRATLGTGERVEVPLGDLGAPVARVFSDSYALLVRAELIRR